MDKISIVCDGIRVGYHNGWHFSQPRADDYRAMAEKFFGKNRNFTVYYDELAVCGHVTPRHRKIKRLERLWIHFKLWIYINLKNRKLI